MTVQTNAMGFHGISWLSYGTWLCILVVISLLVTTTTTIPALLLIPAPNSEAFLRSTTIYTTDKSHGHIYMLRLPFSPIHALSTITPCAVDVCYQVLLYCSAFCGGVPLHY